MDRGEYAVIYSEARHCYGDIGYEDKQLHPLSSENSYRMKIDLELHDWKDPPDIETLSIDERLYWRLVLIFIFWTKEIIKQNFETLVIKNDNEEIFFIVVKNIQVLFNVIVVY